MCVEKANGSSEEQKWKSERSGVLWASSNCVSNSLCHVQTSVVSKLFFSNVTPMEKIS